MDNFKRVNYFSSSEKSFNVFEDLKLASKSDYVKCEKGWLNSKDNYFIRLKSIDFMCSTHKKSTKFLRYCPNIYNFGGNTSRFYIKMKDINIII